MTLVEVIVAAAILFFIMTAILGLVGRTTMISAQARQINTVNNAVNSYIEYVRSLPFAMVAVSPSGSLDTTVVATGDFSVQIVPTVQANANPYLKNLWLAITATRPDGTMRMIDTMVIIHDRDQYMTESSQSPLTDPSIIFLSACPPDGAVVWNDSAGSYWRDASGTQRPLVVAVRATATSGRTVEEVYIQGEQTWDLAEADGVTRARWYNPSWSDSPSFYWDLKQTTALGEPLVQEGIRSIYAYVKDSAGVIRWEVRQFLVDNLKPSAVPSPLTHDYAGTMCGTLSWPLVMDGTSPAYGYTIDIRKQPMTPATAYSSWAYTPGYTGPNTSFALAKDPMSRYYARVRANSPRWFTAYSPLIHFVTRPKVTGTYVVTKRTSTPKGWTVTGNLTATAPSFESSGTTYSWYEGTTLLATTTTNTYALPLVKVDGDPSSIPFPSRSYNVVVRTQPLGLPSFSANPAVEVKSNIVTTSATAAGTFTFAEGTW